MIKPLLTIKDMGRLLGRSTEAVRKDLQRHAWNRICPPMRLGSRVYWREEDVQEWVARQAVVQGVAQIAQHRSNPPAAPTPSLRRPGRPRKSVDKK